MFSKAPSVFSKAPSIFVGKTSAAVRTMHEHREALPFGIPLRLHFLRDA